MCVWLTQSGHAQTVASHQWVKLKIQITVGVIADRMVLEDQKLVQVEFRSVVGFLCLINSCVKQNEQAGFNL